MRKLATIAVEGTAAQGVTLALGDSGTVEVIGEVEPVGEEVDGSLTCWTTPMALRGESLDDGSELGDGVGDWVGEDEGSVGLGEEDPVGASEGDGEVDVGTPDGEGPVVLVLVFVGDVGSAGTVEDGSAPSSPVGGVPVAERASAPPRESPPGSRRSRP